MFLHFAPLSVKLALAATAILPGVAILRRRHALPEAAALVLLIPSLVAAGVCFHAGFPALVRPVPKLDVRSIALFHSFDMLFALGPTLLACAALSAVHRDLRRASLAVLAPAASATVWAQVLIGRVKAIALVPQEAKIGLWAAGEQTQTALLVGVFLAAAISAGVARRPVAMAVSLAVVLPLLVWPEHLVWQLLAEP